jgi:hypothetical protein
MEDVASLLAASQDGTRRHAELVALPAAARRLNAAFSRQSMPFNGPILIAAGIGSTIPHPGEKTNDPVRFRWLAAFI